MQKKAHSGPEQSVVKRGLIFNTRSCWSRNYARDCLAALPNRATQSRATLSTGLSAWPRAFFCYRLDSSPPPPPHHSHPTPHPFPLYPRLSSSSPPPCCEWVHGANILCQYIDQFCTHARAKNCTGPRDGGGGGEGGGKEGAAVHKSANLCVSPHLSQVFLCVSWAGGLFCTAAGCSVWNFLTIGEKKSLPFFRCPSFLDIFKGGRLYLVCSWKLIVSRNNCLFDMAN